VNVQPDGLLKLIPDVEGAAIEKGLEVFVTMLLI
jgi:hypothetical protein